MDLTVKLFLDFKEFGQLLKNFKKKNIIGLYLRYFIVTVLCLTNKYQFVK